MATIRPKDLATTATSPAADDYMVLDGDTEGTRKALTRHADPGAGGVIRYVSKEGSDSNDGTSWGRAKLTVAAAVKSLPRAGSGGSARYEGVIHIGVGEFIETDTPIPVSASTRLFGQGTHNTGTLIKLGDGRNTHLFAPEDTFTDWAHHTIFADMQLDGNKANNTGEIDIVRLFRPGFNAGMYNIFFRNGRRHGLKIINNAANFYSFNLTGSACDGACIHINFETNASLANVAFYGSQIDNCSEVGPVQIVSEAEGNNTVAFYGLETEAFAGTTNHNHVIHYSPVAGSNGTRIVADCVSAFRNAAIGVGAAVIYEAAGDGASAIIRASNVLAQGYTNSIQSAKNSFAVPGNLNGMAMNRDLEFCRQFDGIILRSPNGTRRRVQVNDSGTLTVTAL